MIGETRRGRRKVRKTFLGSLARFIGMIIINLRTFESALLIRDGKRNERRRNA